MPRCDYVRGRFRCECEGTHRVQVALATSKGDSRRFVWVWLCPRDCEASDDQLSIYARAKFLRTETRPLRDTDIFEGNLVMHAKNHSHVMIKTVTPGGVRLDFGGRGKTWGCLKSYLKEHYRQPLQK